MKKQHILAEIKRTAADNGGAPLGYKKFTQTTGIRVADWRGRYWARWGDALVEAGYTRNSFAPVVYDPQTALERLALLTRELGRLPVESEIDMRRRGDATFPSMKVFRKLGSVAMRTRQLADFCRASGKYDDVLSLCVSTSDNHEPGLSDVSRSGEVEIGFVYLLKSGRYYKIGYSNAAGRRERELQIQLPEKAKTVHTIRTDDPSGIEGYWHRRFASRRLNGEWFDLTAADVSAFKRRRFQ